MNSEKLQVPRIYTRSNCYYPVDIVINTTQYIFTLLKINIIRPIIIHFAFERAKTFLIV